MDSDNSDFIFVHFPQRKERVKKAVAWEYVSSPKDEVFETPFQKTIQSVSLRQLTRYANMG